MKFNKSLSLLLAFVLLFTLAGIAAADDGTPPIPPETEPTENETDPLPFLQHPVVMLLNAYYDVPAEEPEPPAEGEPLPEPAPTVGEQVAALHADGMGFGVLTKFLSIAAKSAEACAADPSPDCGVSLDDLVTAFKDGAGIGAIYRDYGKPSALGVGHVKQELKEREQQQLAQENAGEDNGNGRDKEKSNNGKGGGKGKK
jgi:hypothetical protein